MHRTKRTIGWTATRGVSLALGLALMAAGCGSNRPAETAREDQPKVEQSAPKEPNRTNELPFGRVDLPKADTVVTDGRVSVSGWAVDDSAVKKVRVYVDSHFYATVELTIPRNDLLGPLTKYMHGTNLHGWSADVRVGRSPGAHSILVQAEDDQGATRDLGTVSVTVPATKS